MKKSLLFAVVALFSLATTAQTIIMTEDFESGTLPTGWAQTTSASDGGWQFGTASQLGSQSFPFAGNNTKFAGTNDDACNCDKSNDFLYTANVDLTAYSGQAVFLSFKQYFFNLSYQGAQESGTIEVSMNGGASWTVFSQIATVDVWETAIYDLSSLAGNSVMIGFRYNDGSGWTYGMGLDDITVYVPADRDVTLSAIDIPSYHKLSAGAIDIKGTVNNNGGTAITSIDIEYTVNGGSAVTAQLTGLNIAPLSTFDFTHPTPWTPGATGDYTIELKVTAVNGQPDVDPSDNVLSDMVNIFDQSYDRVVLYEMFTSSTCAPCLPGNQNFEGIMANVVDEEYASVKYQMNWPGSGDPYFTNDGDSRKNYYAVNSVPRLEIDGGYDGNSNSFLASDHTDALEVPAFVEIDAEYTIEPDSQRVKACATIRALSDMGNNTLHFAITEATTTQNTGSNGETEFFNVLKKMMPNANGQSISITTGMEDRYCESYVFQGSYRLPNNAGDMINDAIEHSVEDFSDLLVVVWVQDDATKTVLNSSRAELVTEITSVNELPNSVTDVRIYPNPAVDYTNVEFMLDNNAEVSVRVFDLAGKTVLNIPAKSYVSGKNNVVISNDNLRAGIYQIEILTNGVSTVKQLIIQ